MARPARIGRVVKYVPQSEIFKLRHYPAQALDLNMLVIPGGRERTEEEYQRLLSGAAFRLARIIPTHSPFSVIEATRT
jgi:hypothetical protein